jgi:hypothetical protein
MTDERAAHGPDTGARAGAGPELLRGAFQDDLARMIVELLAELWITRDRLFVLERTLVDLVGLDRGTLDRPAPDAAFARELDAERLRLVRRVLLAPFSQRLRSIEEIIARESGEPRRQA